MKKKIMIIILFALMITGAPTYASAATVVSPEAYEYAVTSPAIEPTSTPAPSTEDELTEIGKDVLANNKVNATILVILVIGLGAILIKNNKITKRR